MADDAGRGEAAEAQALRHFLRGHLPAVSLRLHHHRWVSREVRVRPAAVYASAMETALRGRGGWRLVVIVFYGAGKQDGVDFGMPRAEGRSSESTMSCGRAGHGCPICEPCGVAVAILPPRLDLGYSYSDILSWAAEPLVSVLHGNASLTMQRLSEQRFRTTPARDLVEHTHSPRWWYHQWRWLQSLVLRVIDSQKHLRAGLADRPTWQLDEHKIT
jgi:hypothetical protein